MSDSHEKSSTKAAWIGFAATVLAAVIGFTGLIIVNSRQKDDNAVLLNDYNATKAQLVKLQNEYSDLNGKFTKTAEDYEKLKQAYNSLLETNSTSPKASDTSNPNNSSVHVNAERVLLNKVKPLKQDDLYDWTETNIDNFGNKYTNGYLFKTNFSGLPYATFILDKKYTTLTATVTPASNNFESGHNTKLVFYSLSDYGTTKLYETNEITMLTRPYKITVSLSDVDTLMIELQTTKDYSKVGLVDAYME